MKSICTSLTVSFISIFFFTSVAFAQTDSARRRPSAPPPMPMGAPQVNAGFDVIIKKNREIIYGLVKEVGPEFIVYQRTDIPDGPYYTIPRYEVYAISYRNQVKDILDPLYQDGDDYANRYSRRPNYNFKLTRQRLFSGGIARLGLGFIRSYSKVKDANQYSSNATFPTVSAAYDVLFKKNIRLGVQLAVGTHKFSNDVYSLYDSTQSSVKLKESIFTLYVYGRYDILQNSTSALRPYVTVGVGLNTAHITSETSVSFLENNDKVLIIKSGTRSAGLGIMARVGTDYYFNNKWSAFLDAGIGASILNLGVSINLN